MTILRGRGCGDHHAAICHAVIVGVVSVRSGIRNILTVISGREYEDGSKRVAAVVYSIGKSIVHLGPGGVLEIVRKRVAEAPAVVGYIDIYLHRQQVRKFVDR